MPIFVNNTLTRKKEEFIPIVAQKINLYTCGVTVYDQSHIGHARSLYIFDVIRRYLQYRGFKVTFVRNITDIDDKIINRAKELGNDWQEVVKTYIDSYYQDLKALGIEKADFEPRATENIPDMVKVIETLISKGCAYETQTGVYFSVRKFKDYGKLSGQSIEQIISGTRSLPDETKQDPLDFALWKKSKPDEPFWDSPWGKGRPGWHIECSVMSQKFLKTETLDIHAGGRDLIFPHHENEIAQAESFTGKPFARYWIHHGLLTINNQKMAKSSGNFVTIKDFLNKYKNNDILKLFFLSAHYSHPIDYNEEKIKECIKQRKSFDDFFDLVNTSQSLEGNIKPKLPDKDKTEIDGLSLKFEQAMDDDFNTPVALASLFELMDFASSREFTFDYALVKMENLFNILGLRVKPKLTLPPEILKLLKDRFQARKNKDFVQADKIREEIKKHGFNVSDTGTSFSLIQINT
jgi:cysteinyl-tRNA synthetase